jgi:hypothetical protein
VRPAPAPPRHVDVSENEYAVTNLAAKIEAGRKLEAVI